MSATSRPLPAIPLSPPSPPDLGVKQRPKRPFPDEAPHSPASPPLMSVATKSYVSYPNTQTESDATPSHQFSSPTSTFMTSQDHQTDTANNSLTFSPPSNKRDSISRPSTADGQERHRDKRQRMEADPEGSAGMMEVDVQAGVEPLESRTDASQISRLGESPLASDDMSLEQLQKEMGEAFLLCKSTFNRSQPSPSRHLLAIYGLSPLYATVARTDPETGDKINKLRKSYEGKIKDFSLSGKNKPVKVDIPEGGKGNLRSLLEDVPEEQWRAEEGSKKIEVTPSFANLLRKAMEMRPGPVRDNEMWEENLGHEKPRPMAPGPESTTAKKNSVAPGPMRQPNGGIKMQSTTAPDAVRPKRLGKKRSYADNSFEGYGDGYVDDEGELDAGALSGSDDGVNGPGRKKRKKEHSFSISPPAFERPTSYGVGGYVDSR